jgi:hypothetical protein
MHGVRNPGKHQDTQGNRQALSRAGSESCQQPGQQPIKRNIRRLPGDKKTVNRSAADLQCQPGIVQMTGKIAGLDSLLPEARHQNQPQKKQESPFRPLMPASHRLRLIRCLLGRRCGGHALGIIALSGPDPAVSVKDDGGPATTSGKIWLHPRALGAVCWARVADLNR